MPILQRLKQSAGFTMIELLVVIAVIGVLAVAVLAALNPLEQINKGRDTRTRSDAAELLNSSERFFTTQEIFPWNKDYTAGTVTGDSGHSYDSTGATEPDDAFALVPGTADETNWAWVWNLASTSEVKNQYAQRMNLAGPVQYLFGKEGGGAMEPLYACFKPTSRQFRLEAARKCCTTGNCPTDPLAGMAPTEVGGEPPCVTDDGTEDADNYICLP